MIGCVERVGQRFRDSGEVRDNRPIAVGGAALEKRGQIVAEPAQTRMPRRNSADIGACQRVEGGVAKVGSKNAVPDAYRFEEPQQCPRRGGLVTSRKRPERMEDFARGVLTTVCRFSEPPPPE